MQAGRNSQTLPCSPTTPTLDACFPQITSMGKEKLPDTSWHPQATTGDTCFPHTASTGWKNQTNTLLCTSCHQGIRGVATQAERRRSPTTTQPWPQCGYRDLEKLTAGPTGRNPLAWPIPLHWRWVINVQSAWDPIICSSGETPQSAHLQSLASSPQRTSPRDMNTE